MGSTSNPWYVPRIEDFQFFCCPECDIKVKDSQDFINHALALHEQAKDSPFIKLDVKVETKDVNGQIEDCGDTVSKLEKHEDNRTSDADFVLEDIHDDDFQRNQMYFCV